MKRLKNLAFAVVLGTVLISALTVTAGAVVTESSGNGKALYNGVELPDINTVWTDKVTYPYAWITGSSEMNVFILYITSSKVIYDGAKGQFVNSGAISAFMYMLQDGEWKFVASDEREESGSIIFDASNINWASYDILNDDGTVFLAASSPIPLDGMNVITWDGVTDGLFTFQPMDDITLVKVLDTPITANELRHGIIGTVILTDNVIGAIKVEDLLADGYSVDEDVENGFVALSSGNLFPFLAGGFSNSDTVGSLGGEVGTYILANQSDFLRLTLLAYPASSELPPDEGGSDIDFSRTSLTINDFDIYDDSAEYAVSWAYLPDIPYPNNIQYYLRGSLSDYSFGVFDVYLGSSDDPPQALGPVWYDFTDLTPGTEYTFTAELLYTYGYSVNPTYLSSGVTVSDTFTTASTSDVSDDGKAIINAIDNANRDNQQWLDSNYGEAVGDLPEDTASTDAMIGDLDLKEEAYKNDAFDRFQELSSAFTGFDGDVASGIGLAGTLFSRFFNALGSYKIIYTFPLLLGLALVIIGRLGRSGGPRSGRDHEVPGQFKMDSW